MRILVTGAAGFIGFHLCKKLIENKSEVVGLDNLNNYYSINLKNDKIKTIKNKNFIFFKKSIGNSKFLKTIFQKYKFDYVLNLAAQAGVRYSILKPQTYIENNILNFSKLLELSKRYKIKHFVYASSSSVYGLNSSKKSFSVSTESL